MSGDDSRIHAKITDAENEIDRLEKIVTTVIFVTLPIAIATYSTIL
ncbi:hypothetical protein HPT29_013360 [Microvirga terrae]|uniref:Uncharacterized protein n=1 Tax=Microvirga terrae TaxID=2740529 RepID=A0ABY5RK12_9HYPH|nr:MULTISPECIES: hypothetical protein [Microvirga]MBQ0821432.1 hypothetical protein [Microvirga sp. HBU67558]UVF17540.1 hypothetical protein HPT29_013360 [Microvirga terrae]